MTRSAPRTIALEHAGDRAPRHSVQRLVRLHKSAPQGQEQQASDADNYAQCYDAVGTHGALGLREARQPLRKVWGPPPARKNVDDSDSAHAERKSDRKKNDWVHHNFSNAERQGERWRRTPSARIGKQVPPSAIRSTEKLCLDFLTRQLR